MAGKAAPALAISGAQARAIWWARQGFGGDLASPDTVLAASGWTYTAGGTGPYLAFGARGVTRQELDAAVFDAGTLLEVSAVRGAKMLVPRADAALALRAGRIGRAKEIRKIREAVAADPEAFEALCEVILAILGDGELTNDQIRAALPPGLVPPLSDAAKRMGVSSTQAWALWELTGDGQVQRRYGGRSLDAREYRYRRMGPLAPPPESDEDALAALAEGFFDWAGPATVKEFAFFANCPQRDAKTALARCDLVPIDVAGEPAWLLAQDVALAKAAGAPEPGQYRFLPIRDNYLYLRRGLKAFLDGDDGRRTLPGTEAPQSELPMLPYHAVVESGRLVGVWDWDPGEGRVLWLMADRPDGSRLAAFLAAVERLEANIKADHGDLRLYAMETPAGRKRRLDALRG